MGHILEHTIHVLGAVPAEPRICSTGERMRQVYMMLLMIMFSQLIVNFGIGGIVNSNFTRGFLIASSSIMGFCIGSIVAKGLYG
jgi:hypothetical protein